MLTQFLLVATIFGAFSMSAAVAFLVVPERSRLRTWLVAVFSLASLAFIFATALDAVLLPATKRALTAARPQTVAELIRLADAVFWSVILGSLALFGGIGGIGFVLSRKAGQVLLAATVLTAVLFLWFVWRLARVL